MSRIGKRTITLPEKTEIQIIGDKILVTGPLGELTKVLHPAIEVKVDGQEASVSLKKTSGTSALWGAYASHITNMVSGVNKMFEKKLILDGIGFKSDVRGQELHLALGFSHPVVVAIPQGIKVVTEKNTIAISGTDKEQVGQFASKVRSLKKPEPYKGKGMRYSDEMIRRKQGKKSV